MRAPVFLAHGSLFRLGLDECWAENLGATAGLWALRGILEKISMDVILASDVRPGVSEASFEFVILLSHVVIAVLPMSDSQETAVGELSWPTRVSPCKVLPGVVASR